MYIEHLLICHLVCLPLSISYVLSSIETVHDDYVYVTDGHNHWINVYDLQGTFQFTFGEFGNGDGQLKLPWGIITDREGNILVADQGNKRIQVLHSSLHANIIIPSYLYRW